MQQSPACSTPRSTIVRPVLLGVLVVVGVTCLNVFTPFVAAITRPAILAYTSWPLYQRVRKLFGRFTTVGASVITLLLTAAVVVPVLWMLVHLLGNAPYPLPGFIKLTGIKVSRLCSYVRRTQPHEIDRHDSNGVFLLSRWRKHFAAEPSRC